MKFFIRSRNAKTNEHGYFQITTFVVNISSMDSFSILRFNHTTGKYQHLQPKHCFINAKIYFLKNTRMRMLFKKLLKFFKPPSKLFLLQIRTIQCYFAQCRLTKRVHFESNNDGPRPKLSLM